MSEDAGGPSGFELASAFVQVNPNTDTFAGQLESELGALDYAIQIPVTADTAGLPESVDAAVAATNAAITVPVVADAANLAAQVDSAVAATDTTITVPVTADTAGLADQLVSEAGAAGEESGAAFRVRFSAAVASADLFPAQESAEAEAGAGTAGGSAGTAFGEQFVAAAIPRMSSLFSGDSDVLAESGAAGEEAGMAFGNGFSAVALARMSSLFSGDSEVIAEAGAAGDEAGMAFSRGFTAAAEASMASPVAAGLASAVPEAEAAGASAGQALGGALGTEAKAGAAAAGEEGASGFASKFSSMLAGIPLLGNIIPGVEAEAATAGEGAGSSLMNSMKGIIGGDLPVMETLMGAGFVAATAVMATSFDSAMERIHTQAGVGQSAISGLSGSVLSLAGQVGTSPDSLAQALYHIESSFQSVGITGSAAMSLLQTAAEGARVGGANLVDVTNALDATIASGVGGVKNYSQAMGALNAIVGAGDMTMQDLSDAMGSGLMANAKLYGQSLQEVGAALATLGDNNVRGAKAATDLKMAWQAMLSPLATAKPMLADIGLNMTQLGVTLEHQGMTAAVDQFVTHLKSSKVPVAEWGTYVTDIFGKKAGSGIGILIDQLGRLQSKFPDIQKGADNFGSDWAATEATASQKVHDLEAGFQALMIRIGNGLLPALNSFMGMLTSNLPTVERFGTEIAHLVAPFVTAFFTGLEAILKVLFGPLRDVTIAIGAFAAAWVALDLVMAMNPFVAIGIALVTLVGLIVKYHEQIFSAIKKYWHDIEIYLGAVALAIPVVGQLVLLVAVIVKYHKQIFDAIKSAWNAITQFFSTVWNAITSGWDSWWAGHGKEMETVWNGIKVAVTVAWDAITAYIKVQWDEIMAVLKPGMDLLNIVFKTGWDEISAVVKTAWDVMSALVKVDLAAIEMIIKTAWDVIVGIYNVALDLLTGHWSKAMTDMQTTATQVWNAIKQFFSTIWNAIYTLVVQIVNNLITFFTQSWNAVKNGVTTAFNDVRSTIAGIWNGILSDITGVVNKIKSVVSTVLSAPGKAVSSVLSAVGLADGGLVPGFAPGGMVTAGTGPRSDDVLVRVSRGETIVSAAHSRKLAPVFASVGVPGYAGGGIVTPSAVPDAMASTALAALANLLDRMAGAAGVTANGISPVFGGLGAAGVPQPYGGGTGSYGGGQFGQSQGSAGGININFYGTSMPTPEQTHALMTQLSAAVGVS
jgi:TP901 family phage tail tape measure protein